MSPRCHNAFGSTAIAQNFVGSRQASCIAIPNSRTTSAPCVRKSVALVAMNAANMITTTVRNAQTRVTAALQSVDAC